MELARQGIEAFRSADWTALAEIWDPRIVIRTDASWPEQGVYGRENAVAWVQGVWDSGGPDLDIEEAVDLGDRVLLDVRWVMRGDHSRLESEVRYSQVLTFRGGLVILNELFLDRGQARKAVGLEE